MRQASGSERRGVQGLEGQGFGKGGEDMWIWFGDVVLLFEETWCQSSAGASSRKSCLGCEEDAWAFQTLF